MILKYLKKLNLAFCNICFNTNSAILDPKIIKRKYQKARIIVINDYFNTFEHIANSLETIIPGMSRKNPGNWLSK